MNLLIELGTEELPPKSLKTLSSAFSNGIAEGLSNLGLNFDSVDSFAAPRRLAVRINGLDAQQQDKSVEKLGPNVKAAYDKEGNPSPAALGFARSNSVEFSALSTTDTPKGERLVYRSVEPGKPTLELIEQVFIQSLAQLPIAKRMRWGASRSEFVRPIHWIVALSDSDIVSINAFDITSGRTTRGHRFHSSDNIAINSADSYESQLEQEGKVIASFERRRELVEQGTKEQATLIGAHAIIEEDLLDEVTGLIEWPVALAGSFDESFLEVPAEALISSMKEHQKYFHVVDKDGALLPNFIFISNIESTRPQSVIEGNEKVIRPRLADAAFFFNTDKKRPLESRIVDLDKILFQKDLGTVKDKSLRIADLAAHIATLIGGDEQLAKRAGELCKTDLSTEMVLEFDDLQGIAGQYYATHDGEHADVASAMREQYLPKFAGDALPNTLTGCAVALADRIDTICGIFSIGQIPSGSKDPFALRRASIGALRIIIEKGFDIDLKPIVARAINAQQASCDNAAVEQQVLDYMFERFRAWYVEEGITAEVLNAVLAKSLSNPGDFAQRVAAVSEFAKAEEAQALAAANKRVANILAKAESLPDTVNESLFNNDDERALHDAISTITAKVTPLYESKDYNRAFTELATMRAVVDSFFDNVMVNDDDPAIRANRIALLNTLHNLFGHIADISRLVIK